MTNFFRTASIFYRNPYINPHWAVLRHIGWQWRKLMNAFPYDVNLGRIKMRVHDRSVANGCGALLNAMGYYDPNNMFLAEELFSRGLFHTFFDIGANIGAYSVIVAAQPETQVFAFEPHPYTFSLLKENIELNHLGDRVTCVQAALGDRDGDVSLTDTPGSPVNHILDSNDNEKIAVKVRLLRSETFCSIHNLQPDVLKIDVEGHENFVLRGFGEILKSIQLILVECKSVEETTRLLRDQSGFWGPYKMNYHARRFIKANNNYEDWIFVNPKALHLFRSAAFQFDLEN